MKKVLLLIYPTFSEFEITVATNILRHSHQIITAGLTQDVVIGESGLQFVPHVTISEIDPHEYEALIIPGGDLFHVKDSEELFLLVNKFYTIGKLVAAICGGPYVLARAGVLKQIPYTCTYSRKQREFLNCFNEEGYIYAPLVEQGNVITAQGHSYVEFGVKIGERLGAINNLEATKAFYKGISNQMMEVE